MELIGKLVIFLGKGLEISDVFQEKLDEGSSSSHCLLHY